jgi:peptidoglycan-associated lipoprotein
MKFELLGVSGVLAAALLLAACEGVLPQKEEEKPAEVVDKSAQTSAQSTSSSASQSTAPSTAALPSSQGFQGHPLDNPEGFLAQRVIYFDFDSDRIRQADRPVLEAHAEYLASDANASVTLEGHADERGSREYNVGLGERRAAAVRRVLTLLGTSDGHVRTVSYGEERPAALGHDESAWSQNRRVELHYDR